MMEQYEVNPDDGDDAEKEPPEILDDDHFTRLNLDAMTSDWSFTQGGPEEDPSKDFEVGQQFGNKEEVMLAVVIGAYLYHIAKIKKGGRLGDTLVLILACKLRWGKIIVGWIRK
ncbi:hypothetical protein AHAS_Ahas05G0218200 [Arachis hypogaea]